MAKDIFSGAARTECRLGYIHPDIIITPVSFCGNRSRVLSCRLLHRFLTGQLILSDINFPNKFHFCSLQI